MCKKNILLFYIPVILILGNACTHAIDKDRDYQTITVQLNDAPIYLSTLFDNIKPIPFETNDSSLIGANPDIQFTKTNIFIKSDNTIKIFDSYGKYLNTINRRGNGYGEYTSISDFFINEKLNRVEILDKGEKKILYYHNNGEYIDDYPIDIWAVKIFRDAQNRLYVYSGYERDDKNFFKFNVTENGKNYSFAEIDRKKSEFLHISNPVNFFKSKNDGIIFFEPFNDTIYTLKKDKIIPKYLIFYNGQNIPESFYQKNNFSNVFEFFQEFNKHDYVNSTYNVIETDNVVIFYCRKREKKYLIVYDKINKVAHSYDRIIDDFFSTGREIPFQDEEFTFFAKDNTVLFLIQPSWFINNEKQIIPENITFDVNNLNEEDNPIGVFCSLR